MVLKNIIFCKNISAILFSRFYKQNLLFLCDDDSFKLYSQFPSHFSSSCFVTFI